MNWTVYNFSACHCPLLNEAEEHIKQQKEIWNLWLINAITFQQVTCETFSRIYRWNASLKISETAFRSSIFGCRQKKNCIVSVYGSYIIGSLRQKYAHAHIHTLRVITDSFSQWVFCFTIMTSYRSRIWFFRNVCRFIPGFRERNFAVCRHVSMRKQSVPREKTGCGALV
jgi:hypothetical protein